MEQRFRYIDRLKGLAILFVILGHYVIFVLHQKDIVLELIGSFHMPLFMFLSGLVIGEIPKSSKLFRKIIALIMPFGAVGFLYTISIGESYMNFLSSDFKFGYWYLYVLAIFYFLVQLLRLTDSGVGRIVISLLIYVVVHIVNGHIPKDVNEILSFWLIRQYWPFFIIGYFFRFYSIVKWLKEHNWSYTMTIPLYVAGFFFYLKGNGHLFYLVALCFIVFIVSLFVFRENSDSLFERQLSFFGKKTLDIYVYHFFILNLTHLDVLGRWFTDTGNYFLEVLLGAIYSVLVSYICIGIGNLVRMSDIFKMIIYGDFSIFHSLDSRVNNKINKKSI